MTFVNSIDTFNLHTESGGMRYSPCLCRHLPGPPFLGDVSKSLIV